MATVTFLGTGTSQGVPVIGCDCEVCQSDDPRDQRLRCSILVKTEETTLVVDTGPDFRQQMLLAQNRSLDAILVTHEHNDHIAGLDDVRPFNFMQWCDMPVYALGRVCEALKTRYPYVFEENPYPGSPMIELLQISRNDRITIGDIPVIPIEIQHGSLPVLGFRFGNFAYLTDMKTISQKEIGKLEGLDVLVLNALHHREHHSHLNLEQALEFIEQIKPQQAYLTHIAHSMGTFVEVSKTLPKGVALAFDQLQLDISLTL